MQVQPKDRYETALDLAADVENYLADEPVSVLSETRSQRISRWVRRHRFAAQSAALGVAAVVLISILAAAWLGTLARREHAARALADISHTEAQTARQENLETTARTMAQAVGYEIDVYKRQALQIPTTASAGRFRSRQPEPLCERSFPDSPAARFELLCD